VLVIPALFLVDDDTARRVTEFAEAGGTVVIGVLSGLVDENNQVRLGGYPGAFRELLGVWSEEVRPLQDGERFRLDIGWGGTEWTEHVRVEDAQVLVRYSGGTLDGLPAVTARDIVGGGRALYVSAAIDRESIDEFVASLVPAASLPELPDGVELVIRENDVERFSFFFNHTRDDLRVPAAGDELLTGESVAGSVELRAGAVRVVRSAR
jgi:beta-galactosidase